MKEVKAYMSSHKSNNNVYQTASEALLMDVEFEIREAVAKINCPNVPVTQIRATLHTFVSLDISPWKLFRLYSRIWGWNVRYKQAKSVERIHTDSKDENIPF